MGGIEEVGSMEFIQPSQCTPSPTRHGMRGLRGGGGLPRRGEGSWVRVVFGCGG